MSGMYDLAVVGAGVLGCAVAREACVARPEWRVALLDRRQIASGCSAYAGAIASPLVRSERLRAMSDYSRDWYRRHALDDPAVPLHWRDLTFIADAGNEAALRARSSRPLLTAQARLPAWLVPGDTACRLDGGQVPQVRLDALCRHWARQAQIALYECTPVRHWSGRAGRWTLLLGDGRELECRRLVLAKGAWTTAQDLPAGAAVKTKKIVSYALDLPVAADDPMIYLFDHDAFLLPQPALGQWWLSVTSPHWDCLPHGEGLDASAEDLALAHGILARYAPSALTALRGASVHCDAYGDDFGPQVFGGGEQPLVATGGSGSGFRYAPAIAAEVLRRLSDDGIVPA